MFRVSCIQLCSSDNVEYNLKKTKQLILKAVKQKTNFILTPEVSSKISLDKKKLLKTATSMDKDFYLHEIKGLAKKYKKWILIGSLILKIGKNKLVNRSILITPKGRIKCYYDKLSYLILYIKKYCMLYCIRLLAMLKLRQNRLLTCRLVDDTFNKIKSQVDLGKNSKCCAERAYFIGAHCQVVCKEHRYKTVTAKDVDYQRNHL